MTVATTYRLASFIRSPRCASAPRKFWTAPKAFNYRGVRPALLLAALAAVVGYFLTVTAVATSGYRIHNLETKIESLTAELQTLEVELAADRSLPAITSRLKQSNLIPATAITYLKTQTAVAAAR